MKKTLILTALLAGMPAMAETVTVFADGYSTANYLNAYNYQMVGKMCWGANAANVISWWQDQLVAQGYTLPEGVPTQTAVFTEYQAGLDSSKGGYPDTAVEWWLDGYYNGGKKSDPDHVGNFYSALLKPMDHNNYQDTGTMIKQFFPATCGSRAALSKHIVESLQQGYALITNVGSTSVTVWGADYDTDTGLLTHVYYSDPHNTTKVWHSALTEATDAVDKETFSIAGTGTIAYLTGLPCHIEDYLTEAAYTDQGGGAFSPVYNVEVDNGTGYTVAKELKAAAKGSALEGVVNGDITIKDGSATMAEGGSTQGAVVFTGTTDKSRTLSVQRDGLTLSSIQVDATVGTNTLAVAEGKTVTVTAMSGEGSLVKTGDGTLVNGGTLGNIELREGALKGSGAFANVAVNGGRLIVGNSPGRQTYTGNLSVNLGEIVFSVDGWETPATGDNCGWASGTYSNIVMDGGSLTLGDGSTLEFALGGGAMATLLANPSTAFNLTIATGFGNGNEFTSGLLQQLAQQTIFTFSTEDGAFKGTLPEFKDGETLNTHITNLEYKLVDNSKLCVTGVYWAAEPAVPEPSTGTLGLLALAALAARRRRK